MSAFPRIVQPRTVLAVDDEPAVLDAIKRVLHPEDMRVLTATSARQGLAILAEETVQVVLSDHFMAEMTGVEFLGRVKALYPEVVCIVLTGHADVEAIVSAVNQGDVYRFLLKPWDNDNLKLEIVKACEHYELLQYQQELNWLVRQQNKHLQQIHENLEQRVAERTAELKQQNEALEMARVVFEYMPPAVIGMSPEGEVILMNRSAEQLSLGGHHIQVGDCFFDFLEEPASQALWAGLENREKAEAVVRDSAGQNYQLWLSPFADTAEAQGATLTAAPEEIFAGFGQNEPEPGSII